MLMSRHLCLLALSAAAVAQQQIVVPASAAVADSNSFLWVAGFSRDLRQQTIIGSSHLQPMLGRTLTGIAYRRDGSEDEPYAGGTCQMRIVVSTATTSALAANRAFAQNHGGDAVLAFDGTVTVPSSPAPQGGFVPWDAAHTVEIQFSQPFVYTGGDLCVDVLGRAAPSGTVEWWMADCVFEELQGSVTDVGAGCGPFANVFGGWAFVGPRTLLPGATARFWAYGAPGDLMMLLLAVDVSANVAPLAALGLPAGPGCFAHLDPSQIGGTVVTSVAAPPPGLPQTTGEANHRLSIPNQPWVLGARFGAQWLNFDQGFASSNGIRWSVAPAAPSLDMALIQGGATDALGEVSTHQAHVLRLRFD